MKISDLPEPMQRRFRCKFFALQRRAWQAHAYREDVPMNDKAAETAWRQAETLKECGVESFGDLDHVDDFERIMLHWAITAEDDREIAYWSTSLERRYRHLIRERLREISHVSGTPHGWEYVRGIHDQMQLPLRLEECPAEHLHKIFEALDTHLRRLCRQNATTPDQVRRKLRRAA